eukprot:CAMPEP_0201514160 /NCGR_PEP_ID=MMETSP0161_2-20130828/6054_1 /ASSEMBLY_ACC=CAM_ASM_000251 /TAXON_ID=180227 /ORGANISM="Neoparamoeba aestuarina, Strain SoJaBio B1-5/56/2" /LENGTH=230 /DNA_ID=CAMNT_0047910621 /DNA_START=1103 /DNA_END=1795 /DNA_ORIENTATION=-
MKELFEGTKGGQPAGTPAWTAPEVLRGEKYDKRADVYSFGIILWELLTGKMPFKGYNYKIMKAVCDDLERPPIPEGEDEEVIELMTTCWAEEKDKRPAFDVICSKLADIRLRLDEERPQDRIMRKKREAKGKEKEEEVDEGLVFDTKNQMPVKRDENESTFSLVNEIKGFWKENKGKEEEDKQKWACPDQASEGSDQMNFSEEYDGDTRLAFRNPSYYWETDAEDANIMI